MHSFSILLVKDHARKGIDHEPFHVKSKKSTYANFVIGHFNLIIEEEEDEQISGLANFSISVVYIL